MKLGVFTEPAEVYHANRDAVSSTPLRQMDLSPAHFFAAWKHGEVDVTKEMDMGTCLHSLLLEQDISGFAARPIKNGRLVASNTDAYKIWESENEGKTGVHPDFYNSLYDALTAFTKHKTAMDMINSAAVEQSAYAKDPETGLMLKARTDVRGQGYIADLKSTKLLGPMFMNYVFKAQFPFQLAHYGDTFELADGSQTKNHYIIGFETCRPFGIKIIRINRVYIDEAIAQRRAWLNEISVCLKENRWPAYKEEIIEPVRPRYLDKDEDDEFEVAI